MCKPTRSIPLKGIFRQEFKVLKGPRKTEKLMSAQKHKKGTLRGYLN